MHVQLAFGQQQGDAEANNHRERGASLRLEATAFWLLVFFSSLPKWAYAQWVAYQHAKCFHIARKNIWFVYKVDSHKLTLTIFYLKMPSSMDIL